MPQNKSHYKSCYTSQAGNVFIIILLGVFLFGALMYAFTRSANQGTGNLTKQQAKIAAQEIINYARLVEGAVDRVRRNGCSESDISFDNAVVSGYSNPNSPADKSCHVFEENGGQATYAEISRDYIDGNFSAYQTDPNQTWGEWIYTGDSTVPNIGTDCGTKDCKELTANINFINKDICLEINNLIDVPNSGGEPPPENLGFPPGGWGIFKYVGTYKNVDNGIDNANMSGIETACLQAADGGNDYYFFYHVLLAR